MLEPLVGAQLHRLWAHGLQQDALKRGRLLLRLELVPLQAPAEGATAERTALYPSRSQVVFREYAGYSQYGLKLSEFIN